MQDIAEAPATVVLVTDDMDLAQLLDVMLEADPRFTLLQPPLTSGVSPEQMAATSAACFVIDVSGPEGTGLDLVRAARAHTRSRIVAFSLLADPVTLLATLEAGAETYLATQSLWSELIPTMVRLAPDPAASVSA